MRSMVERACRQARPASGKSTAQMLAGTPETGSGGPVPSPPSFRRSPSPSGGGSKRAPEAPPPPGEDLVARRLTRDRLHARGDVASPGSGLVDIVAAGERDAHAAALVGFRLAE